MKDPDLVERSRQGDLGAFEALFERYHTVALRAAYLATGRRELAEDIVQEAFVQCYLNMKRLRRAESFRPWLLRIVTRLSWRMLSRERGSVPLERAAAVEELPVGRGAWGPPEQSREQRELQEALDSLSTPLKTAVILYYLSGYSVEETAAALGCSAGTVKSRLHNARKRLAKALDPDHREE